jgi:UDP-glucose 4-epimerase
MVIPRFVGQALRHEPLTVYGDGTQSRCFCDVQDVVRAVHGLSQHPGAVGKVINIGSREEITILDLAKRIKALTRSRSEIRLIPYDEAYAPGFEDMARRVPDTGLLHSLLGWKPERTLDQTLRRVRESLEAEARAKR